MNVHYTGRQVELSGAQRKKLEPKFQKIHNILGQRHTPETHVILRQERRLYVAEVTLNFQHHTMVVECAGPDVFVAAQEAVEKLEKQIIRNKDKWRERKRRSKPPPVAGSEEAPAEGKGDGALRIFRGLAPAPKPLTIEEAILEMEQGDRDCVVYRDADKGGTSVLFRRRDGNLQLVEA